MNIGMPYADPVDDLCSKMKSSELVKRMRRIEHFCKIDMADRYGPWIVDSNFPSELISEILAFSPQVPPHVFKKSRWVYRKVVSPLRPNK